MEPSGIPVIRDGGRRSEAVRDLHEYLTATGMVDPYKGEWSLDIRAGREPRVRPRWGQGRTMRQWIRHLHHVTQIPVGWWPRLSTAWGPTVILEWPDTYLDEKTRTQILRALTTRLVSKPQIVATPTPSIRTTPDPVHQPDEAAVDPMRELPSATMAGRNDGRPMLTSRQSVVSHSTSMAIGGVRLPAKTPWLMKSAGNRVGWG